MLVAPSGLEWAKDATLLSDSADRMRFAAEIAPVLSMNASVISVTRVMAMPAPATPPISALPVVVTSVLLIALIVRSPIALSALVPIMCVLAVLLRMATATAASVVLSSVWEASAPEVAVELKVALLESITAASPDIEEFSTRNDAEDPPVTATGNVSEALTVTVEELANVTMPVPEMDAPFLIEMSALASGRSTLNESGVTVDVADRSTTAPLMDPPSTVTDAWPQWVPMVEKLRRQSAAPAISPPVTVWVAVSVTFPAVRVPVTEMTSAVTVNAAVPRFNDPIRMTLS